MNQYEPFTEEQNEWLREHYWDMPLKDLVPMFNEKFHANRSYSTIKNRCRKSLGLTRKPNEEMKKFLTDNYYDYSLKELTDKFNKHFCQKRSEGVIKSWVYSMGFHFKENDKRWRDCISENWSPNWKNKEMRSKSKPIGSVYKFNTGYLYIKTDHNKYEMLHKYLWEKENGPVPKGHSLIFLDNNKENCDLSNICCIPGKIHRELIKKGWRFDNAEQTKTAILWYELFYAIKDAKDEVER